MEDQKHQLAQKDAAEEEPGGFDGALHPRRAVSEAPVEGEAGEAAEKEGAGVKNVAGEVEDFSVVDCGVGEDVLDILDVAAGPKTNEDDGKGDEASVGELKQC